MRLTASIGQRLTLLLAGVAALLSLLSWGMVSSLATEAAARTQDNVLAASTTTIAETLRSEQGEIRLELPYAAFAMLGAISEDRVFYRVTAGGRELTGYADLPPPSPGPVGQIVFDTGQFSGEAVRMASVTRLVGAGADPVAVTVTVAQTRNGVQSVASDLSWLAGVLAIAFFFVAVGLSAVAARMSLRPLNQIADSVSRRGPADLRPLSRPAPADLAPLLSALNRLMDRLRLSVRRSEDFIAEAAHRVRTPLATVRTQAEIALRGGGTPAEKEQLRRIIRAVDESARSAGQLLDYATVAYRVEDLARDALDLSELARRSVESVTPTAAMRDIQFTLDLQSAPVRGDAVLLDNAIRNVLDNAIKYSPEDTVIAIGVRQRNGDAILSVRDEGPGFGDDPPDALTERFRRGANTGGIVGSGLGLTIAAEVLRAHGGRLDLRNREDRSGTCVLLVLPLA
ncbi:sensor histidine kinase [Roseibaca sp. Y0-43]|uniref:sensor histidine kinase n=1 Tax=Roseibaca sp. Y0-43 TaxID=2816854 RepID=UPI001D0CC16D|nr:sensor histidine kinase [Roseibaca sp. Y0-43]MCC1480921.1 sensor histidine kinase [Roseibaca sp. Y0-43]